MQFRKEAHAPKITYFDESFNSEDESGQLPLGNTISVDDLNLARVEETDREQKLNKLVKQILTGRELEIVTLRYGLDNVRPRTQREVAAALRISRSYVSRLEKKALERLKKSCLDIGLWT